MKNGTLPPTRRVYDPIPRGVRALRHAAPPVLPAYLRVPQRQRQDGCPSLVQPKLPSQARRCRPQTVADVPLASGALHLVVPRTAVGCQTSCALKRTKASGAPPTAKCDTRSLFMSDAQKASRPVSRPVPDPYGRCW
jgi:hypothetical protein